MSAALRVATLLIFASQALAVGGTQFVCRYTGQEMESCCCPSEKVEAATSATLTDPCCDVRTTERFEVAAVVQQERGKLRPWIDVAVGVVAQLGLAPRQLSVEKVSVRDAGPPSALRLHLRLRHILV